MSDTESWEEYCEVSLDLSNQDNSEDDAPWLDCYDGFKILFEETE